MRNIPGWPIRIDHLHQHRTRIRQLVEDHAWDKNTLPGMDFLAGIPDTDLARPFDDEVGFLFWVVMPRNLPAVWRKLDIALAKVWVLDNRCASNKVSSSAASWIAATRNIGNVNDCHIRANYVQQTNNPCIVICK